MLAPSTEAEQSLTGWFDVGYGQCADEAVRFLQQYLEPQDDVIQGLRGHLRRGNPLQQLNEWHQQEQCCHDHQKHREPRTITDVSLSFESQLLALLEMPSTIPSRQPQLLKDGEQLSSDRDSGFSPCLNPVRALFVPPPIVPTCHRNAPVYCFTQQQFHRCCYSNNEWDVVTPDQSSVSPIVTTSCNNVVTQRFCDKTRCNCDKPTFDNLSESASLQLLDIPFLNGEHGEGKEEEGREDEERWDGDVELVDSATELIRLAVNNPNVSTLLDKLFLLMDEVELSDEEEMGSDDEEEDDYCKECGIGMDRNEE